MNITTHRARIVGSLCYLARTGRLQNIPLGPCLVEDLGGQTVEIIWGPQGQRSAELGAAVFTAAQAQGNLVLLD